MYITCIYTNHTTLYTHVPKQTIQVSPFPVDYSEAKQPTMARYPLNRLENTNGLHFLPVGLIPLMATQTHAYKEFLKQTIADANAVYREFLSSDEGKNFRGQVPKLNTYSDRIYEWHVIFF